MIQLGYTEDYSEWVGRIDRNNIHPETNKLLIMEEVKTFKYFMIAPIILFLSKNSSDELVKTPLTAKVVYIKHDEQLFKETLKQFEILYVVRFNDRVQMVDEEFNPIEGMTSEPNYMIRGVTKEDFNKQQGE